MPGGDALALLLQPWALALLGACVGSFANVVIHRLPRMMARAWWAEAAHLLGDAQSARDTLGEPLAPDAAQVAAQLQARLDALAPYTLARPRSACPACATPIRWWHNLPVVGWLWLRGRCAACGVRISPRYPAIELLMALLFAALGWRLGAQPVVLAWCGFAALLVTAAAIDWDTTLLPDTLTGPLLWGGLVAAALGWTLPLPSAVAGAVAGYGALWLIFWAFKLATGKEGMGAGDFKLLAGIGAWLGWGALIPVALAASLVGIGAWVCLKATGGLRDGGYVPFGPFLAGGALAVLLAGAQTVQQALLSL